MMNTIITIPARFDSKRFPGKLCKHLNGKPIIQWVVERSRACADQVLVLADQQMHQFCQNQSLPSVCVDGPFESGTDRIAHWVRHANLSDDVLIVNIQGDEPAVSMKNVRSLINGMQQCSAPVGTLYHEVLSEGADPNKVKVVLNHSNEALYFSRHSIPYSRDKTPVTLKYHVGVYAYRASWLKQWHELPSSSLSNIESLEQLRILEAGFKVVCLPCVEPHLHGVDTSEDLTNLEKHMSECAQIC